MRQRTEAFRHDAVANSVGRWRLHLSAIVPEVGIMTSQVIALRLCKSQTTGKPIGAGMTSALVPAITRARFSPMHVTSFVLVALYLMLAPVRRDRITREVLDALTAL